MRTKEENAEHSRQLRAKRKAEGLVTFRVDVKPAIREKLKACLKRALKDESK